MDAPAEIKSRLDIADLIGEYLTLKTAGSGTWKAVCPFHQEKTPSFYVSRARQSWHCFGCDQGGDHFTFLEKMEGMEFREALEHLAQKTGVVLPTFDGERSSQKKRLYEINTLAMKKFSGWLRHSPLAEQARAYVAKRGVDTLTQDLFHLGFAPDAWSLLTDEMMKEGVTSHELVLAGLAIKRENGEGVYDRFRGRLMFPIADVHGNIVGFTGRVLEVIATNGQQQQAKYVNTPETPVYRKSALLYGLDTAKGAIRQNDLAVIVEGNMDVIGSHQFGVDHVVASSGTALTQEQLMLLKRFTTRLAIAFDADAAGNAATIRGLDLARQQDFFISIITLPPEAGKDPDDVVRKNPQLWKNAIAEAQSIMEWLYRNAFRGKTLTDPTQKKLIARALLPEIKRLIDPVERDHWVHRLANDLGVRQEALLEAMGTSQSFQEKKQAITHAPLLPQQTISSEQQVEELLLACILHHPATFVRLAEREGLRSHQFVNVNLVALYKSVRVPYLTEQISTAPAEVQTSAGQPIRLPVDLDADQTKIIQGLAFLREREYPDKTIPEVEIIMIQLVRVIRERWIQRERKRLEREMREAERVGDTERIAELARLFSSLST